MRIVGGEFRGRLLEYQGDPRTRPMKDRTREAVFNLLGPAVEGSHAVDLFAGTGALGLEALSRGAARATLLERHIPTAALLRKNVASLGLEDRACVIAGDTFAWARRRQLAEDLGLDRRWLVFCSPPYEFYIDRADDMLALLAALYSAAPPGSLFVVEADRRFDMQRLPGDSWDVRQYPPAVVAIAEKPEA